MRKMRAIITGATKGIGRALCEKFASGGFDLAVCARTKSDLEELKNELTARHGVEILIHPCDVRFADSINQWISFVRSRWDQVDVLINNAGIFIPGEITLEKDGVLETLIETNLYSAYRFTRGILPLIPIGGHIFNMCSIASFTAYPNGGSYSISKFALRGFSKVLREELKPKGIKVTTLLPGATWSASWAGVELPESRLMQANDVAEVVWSAWRLSPSAVMEEVIIRPQLGDI